MWDIHAHSILHMYILQTTAYVHRFYLPCLAGCRVSTGQVAACHNGQRSKLGWIFISAPRSLHYACALLATATNSCGMNQAIWKQCISEQICAFVFCLKKKNLYECVCFVGFTYLVCLQLGKKNQVFRLNCGCMCGCTSSWWNKCSPCFSNCVLCAQCDKLCCQWIFADFLQRKDLRK